MGGVYIIPPKRKCLAMFLHDVEFLSNYFSYCFSVCISNENKTSALYNVSSSYSNSKCCMFQGSIVKSGNTTLVHYTTGGVAQILTTSVATAHVVTAKPGESVYRSVMSWILFKNQKYFNTFLRYWKAFDTLTLISLSSLIMCSSFTCPPVGRNESMGVGSQTVTLVSRTSGPPTALNLASTNPGGGSNPSVRTVSHPSGTQTNSAIVTSSSTQLPYHIPRGAAAVANMSAPRSQTVATPIVRATGQPLGHPNSSLPGPYVMISYCSQLYVKKCCSAYLQ